MADMMKFVLRLGWFRIPFAIEVPDPDSAGGDPNQPGTPAYYAQVATNACQLTEQAAARAEAAVNKLSQPDPDPEKATKSGQP